MRLNDEQNLAFANDPRRIAAEKKVQGIVHHIQNDIRFDGTAQYYLSVLPPLLKDLDAAYTDFVVVEATVQAEILEKIKDHR